MREVFYGVQQQTSALHKNYPSIHFSNKTSSLPPTRHKHYSLNGMNNTLCFY